MYKFQLTEIDRIIAASSGSNNAGAETFKANLKRTFMISNDAFISIQTPLLLLFTW